MKTAKNELASLEMQQAIERLRNELYNLFREKFGRELNPEILLAEAEELVVRHGPNFELKDLFENCLP